MTAHDLFTDLRRQGFILTPLPGGKLEVEPASKLTDALCEVIMRYKPEILAALTGTGAQLTLRQPQAPQRQDPVPLPPPAAPAGDALAATQLFELTLAAWRRRNWGPCSSCGQTAWYQNPYGFSLCSQCVPLPQDPKPDRQAYGGLHGRTS